MRLTPAKIEDLTRQLVAALRSMTEVNLVDEKRAAAIFRDTLLSDLKREDQLEEEVRALLRKHASQIHGDNLNYDLLYQRAKRQLAREKGIIL